MFLIHTIVDCPSDTNNFLEKKKKSMKKISRLKQRSFTVDLT